MVFCNVECVKMNVRDFKGHNPYFNRWFSAICNVQDTLNSKKGSQSLF